MRNIICAALCFGVLSASEQTRTDYLRLIEKHPCLAAPRGCADLGEIEIVLDPSRMQAIEEKTGRDVGVIARDNYWIWINDAVVFPSGAESVYGRMLWSQSVGKPSGVAVMAITPDDKIVVNCNYRHATRSWEIELPRGGVNAGETCEEAARRETIEETGMVLNSLQHIGTFAPDSGMACTLCKMYKAHVVEKQSSAQEETEAIEEILTLSKEELLHALACGYITLEIRGYEVKVSCRDPFLTYALLLDNAF